MTKAAVNFLTLGMHVECPALIAFAVHPGWVQADLGNGAAKANGLKEAPTTIEDSVGRVIQLTEAAKRATHSGKFWNVDDGKKLPW
jgi:norsolorinic acid ketoreductase